MANEMQSGIGGEAFSPWSQVHWTAFPARYPAPANPQLVTPEIMTWLLFWLRHPEKQWQNQTNGSKAHMIKIDANYMLFVTQKQKFYFWVEIPATFARKQSIPLILPHLHYVVGSWCSRWLISRETPSIMRLTTIPWTLKSPL